MEENTNRDLTQALGWGAVRGRGRGKVRAQIIQKLCHQSLNHQKFTQYHKKMVYNAFIDFSQ